MDLDTLFRECYYQGPPIVPYDFCEGVWLPTDYLEVKEAIHNFKVRDDDVWLCGLTRSGTTWSREMIWSIANGLNSEEAEKDVLFRFPSLESQYSTRGNCMFRRLNKPLLTLSIEQLEQLPSPRFIKSHLPYNLLPKQLTEGNTDAKIIYVSRNPKDNCISAYHFYKYLELYCGTFEQFCELYLGGRMFYLPFWKHIAGFWEHKDSKNLLWLKYENMKDLSSEIRRVASFLNKSLTDEQVRILEDYLSFENMKSNPAVNFMKQLEKLKQYEPWNRMGPIMVPLIRKGEANQWKTEMSVDMRKKFDDWIKKNLNENPQLKDEFSYFI